MPSTIITPLAATLPVGHWTMRGWWEQVECCLDLVPEDPEAFLIQEATALLAECERNGDVTIKLMVPHGGLADTLAFPEAALMRRYPEQP